VDVCAAHCRTIPPYRDIDHVTADLSVALDLDVDVVIPSFGGGPLAYSLILNALSSQKFVITGNKAAIAYQDKSASPT
jgi:homoserine dehydrogenase